MFSLRAHYRYELNDAKNSATSEHVLEVWCYEAYRLFRDRLVGADARNRFDNIMATVVRSEWSANVFDNLTCKCYGSFPLPDSDSDSDSDLDSKPYDYKVLCRTFFH